jgi:hypothetical protein
MAWGGARRWPGAALGGGLGRCIWRRVEAACPGGAWRRRGMAWGGARRWPGAALGGGLGRCIWRRVEAACPGGLEQQQTGARVEESGVEREQPGSGAEEAGVEREQTRGGGGLRTKVVGGRRRANWGGNERGGQ